MIFKQPAAAQPRRGGGNRDGAAAAVKAAAAAAAAAAAVEICGSVTARKELNVFDRVLGFSGVRGTFVRFRPFLNAFGWPDDRKKRTALQELDVMQFHLSW